jgi:hypothetical protein
VNVVVLKTGGMELALESILVGISFGLVVAFE